MKPFNTKKFPSQQTLFHFGKWTAEMNATFITELVKQKKHGLWNPPTVPSSCSVHLAVHVVNALFGRDLTFDDAQERVGHLQSSGEKLQRYVSILTTAKYLCVNAYDAMQKNPMAMAYYYTGEAEFLKLCRIFGPMVMKEEDRPPVITISDDTVRINEDVNSVAADLEEVTSPNLGNPRRRLFSTEAESTTMREHVRGVYPPTNAFPPRPRNLFEAHLGFGEFSVLNDGSSCASSSTVQDQNASDS